MQSPHMALLRSLVIVFFVSLISFVFARVITPQEQRQLKSEGAIVRSTLPVMSIAELAAHDGSDPTLPIYIALDGYVYDVSLGRKFYQTGAVYHYLAGKDASLALHIMGGESIKEKYAIIAILQGE